MNEQWRNAAKEDTLKERLLVVTSENKALKSEVEYLKLKIDAMEIADKMTMNHLRTLEKDKEALLEGLKQNSILVGASSSGAACQRASREQTE